MMSIYIRREASAADVSVIVYEVQFQFANGPTIAGCF